MVLKCHLYSCLLYTSDAADERSSVDLGGRRIIKKKKRDAAIAHMFINRKSKQFRQTKTNNMKMN